MKTDKDFEFEIIRKIREQTLQDVVCVESVILSDKGIKIKVSENDGPACTLMCTNKPDVMFINAANYLKPYINTFKQYLLPNEYQLKQIFEEAKKQKFREIRMDEFTEEQEKQLKEEIMNRPSIEKLFIESVELKAEKKDDMEIFYFLMKVIGLNASTGAMEKDEVLIYRDNIPRIIGDKENYESFRDAILAYINEARKHYFAFIKMQETERENSFRRNVLAASQGHLFKMEDLTEFERTVIGRTARDFFPDKFLGEASETEPKEAEPSTSVKWINLHTPMAESLNSDQGDDLKDAEKIADWAIESGDPVKIIKGRIIKNDIERKKQKEAVSSSNKDKRLKARKTIPDKEERSDLDGMEF